MTQPLSSLAQSVATQLQETRNRIVFAESCTAGLVSAVLARVPGISEFHCGSAVVYRLDTKTRWLGVSEQMLGEFGAVSEQVAQAMAKGVLERTPEASISAAITGHLGPNAPEEQDGLIFLGVGWRDPGSGQLSADVIRHVLASNPVADEFGACSLREWRQWKAVEVVLTLVKKELLLCHN